MTTTTLRRGNYSLTTSQFYLKWLWHCLHQLPTTSLPDCFDSLTDEEPLVLDYDDASAA